MDKSVTALKTRRQDDLIYALMDDRTHALMEARIRIRIRLRSKKDQILCDYEKKIIDNENNLDHTPKP